MNEPSEADASNSNIDRGGNDVEEQGNVERPGTTLMTDSSNACS